MPKKNSDMANDISNVVRAGTKKWTRTRKAEERSPASRSYRYSRMTRERGVQLKEAAWEIMEQAYLKVSDNGALPANARQIMYAARPHIQERTGRQLQDSYFTQTLLPGYIEENVVDWNIVYDARGHFKEPHDGEFFGVGTLEVRDYLARLHDPKLIDAACKQATIEICGPSGGFSAVMFIEKEGFDPILKAARTADKFDIAIMSTKGVSVTAARELADEMCAAHDIPLLAVHDFDKSGFTIAGTLQRDSRRYEFQNSIRVVDLGLSLADIREMNITEFEHQHHPKGRASSLKDNLRLNGASEEDIAFMFADFDRLRSTRRVELNAMTSPQFIAFIERKLRENGIAKIVPDQDILVETYIGLEKGRRLADAVAKLDDEIDDAIQSFAAPKDLPRRVSKYLKQHPDERWDAALLAILVDKTVKRAVKRATRPKRRGNSPSDDIMRKVKSVLGDDFTDVGGDE